MNKTYRSIWSESDQTWVAAPETAAARGKSVRRLAVLATSAVGIAASFAPASAGATTTAATPGTVGHGGLELCSGASGYSWGSSGGSELLDCSVDGKGTTDGLTFSLDNAADSKGGYGFNASTVQVAGYQNGTLNIKGASVMVYGPTTFNSVVTMSNQKIVQLAPGLVSNTSTEAVNGSQLYATNANVSNLQNQMANAVMYDTPAHDAVTLGGTGAKAPVGLHNVAAGQLSPASTDAVNGSQLYATNANVSDLQGQVANSVQYDTPAHDAVTLGGAGATAPVALHNVAAGDLSPASTDAVNGSQLYSTNANVSDLQGQVTDSVQYDTPAHDAVTLGGAGAAAPVALHNVAAGDLSPASTDAVNGSQLYATNANVSDLQGQVADSVQYDTPSHDTVTLGGAGATAPVALHNVAAGNLSSTSTDAVNGSQLYETNQSVTNLQDQIGDVVQYDTSAHDAVTFGGTGATAPVALHNVAAGDLTPASTDAINGSQLYATNANVSDLQGQVADSVQYDTPAHDAVTLGGAGAAAPVAMHNVAAGDLSPASTDAVNGSQLYATNQSVTNLQGQIGDVVQYDTSAHDAVTFGGTGATAPVALHNVAAGDLTPASTDAVNGSQLYSTNANVSDLQGQVADSVQYDTPSHDTVTLGGAGATAPVALHNVAAGNLSSTSTDAVNGSQLYATNANVSDLQGQIGDVVQYDTPAHDAVTLGGAGAAAPVALHNVAAGNLSSTSTDAVNGSQLYETNQSVTNLQGQIGDVVQYDTPAHDAVTLGGAGAAAPVALHNVAAGNLSSTSTDAVNGSQLYATNANVSDLQGQVADSVQYDTPAHDAVTLGGAGATAPVALHNVAAGNLSSTSTDAVNGSQLYATNQSVTNLQGQIGDVVQYDTSAHDAVTFGGTGATAPVALHNVAAGDLAPTSTDAVNGSQLYATNQSVTNLQGQIGDVVQYDSPAHDTLTLGGTAATTPVALRNVAAGDLSSVSTDAINGSQLYATNEAVQGNTTLISNLTQNITNGTIGIVQQDPVSRDITVGADTDGTLVDVTGTAGTRRLTGLAAGLGSSDAVNVAQMQSAGFQFDGAGNVLNQAVTYDAGSIASGNPTITLATSTGNSPYFRNADRTQGYLPEGTVISNVANGIQDTDAVNLGQVGDLIAKASAGGNLGTTTVMAARNLAASGTGSGVNSSTLTTAYQTAAYYSQVSGLGDNAGSVGPSDMARAAGAGSIAIGSNAYTPGVNGVAVGVQAYTPANDAVALGSGSVANKDNTVSVGNDGTGSYTATDANGQTYTIQNQANTRRIVNMAAGEDDTDAVNVSQLKGVLSAIGGGATVNADGTIQAPTFAVGGTTVGSVSAAIANLDTRVTQNTADIAALGGGSGSTSTGTSSGTTAATSSDADAVHYDSSSHDSVTLSNTSGGAVTMTGLQNAALTASSTDAVTGQQLYATNQQLATLDQSVQNISTNGSTALSTNSTSGPAAAAGAQSVAVGGGAVATGDNSTALGDKANASAANSVAIGANSIANRANAVSVGQEGAERQIVNVAAGTSGTDAVNLNQMNSALSQQSTAFNQQISGLQNSINTVEKNAYAGVAAAMAMPNLTPSGPGRTVVAAGGGYYKGSSAAAVGVTYRSSNMHWLVNGAVSVTDNGDAGARAQIGYEF